MKLSFLHRIWPSAALFQEWMAAARGRENPHWGSLPCDEALARLPVRGAGPGTTGAVVEKGD